MWFLMGGLKCDFDGGDDCVVVIGVVGVGIGVVIV